MAKRNNKMGMVQQKPAQPKRRAPAGKSASKSDRAGNARAFNRPAQPTSRGQAPANLLTVRIAAIAVALAALVGGVLWATDLQGSGYATPQVIGLVALGFVIGLALYVAVRTELVVTNVKRVLRERR